MTKTLIRLYDREDKTSMIGKCMFLVLNGTLDDLDGDEIERMFGKIAGMGWQHYTSYAVATCDDIKEEECFWSEIMNYEMREVNIDVSRVTITGKYRLPECITG